MARYVALLRGINVGGGNLIRMTALKAAFEELGFSDVATYIQSGNVIFATPRADPGKLAARIEKALSAAFDYRALVVLRSAGQMKRVVEHAPQAFGDDPSTYRYDVLFLKEPLTAAKALQSVSTREGVDEVFSGEGVLYFSRLIARATQSHLPKLASQPVYKAMTVRNWNTTTKLQAMLEA